MNRLAMIAAFWTLAFFAAAQTKTPEFEDQIFLQNGSLIRGKIVEWHQDEWLKIRTHDGLELFFREKQIRKIRQQRFGGPRASRIREHELRERGVYNSTSFGLVPGGGYDVWADGLSYSISHAVGFRFRPSFGAGLGVAFDNYQGWSGQSRFLPVFVDLRSYLPIKRAIPFANLEAGWGFALNPDESNEWRERQNRGGFFLSPHIGHLFRVGRASFLSLDFGLRFQKSRQKTNQTDWREERRISHNRFCFRIGLDF